MGRAVVGPWPQGVDFLSADGDMVAGALRTTDQCVVDPQGGAHPLPAPVLMCGGECQDGAWFDGALYFVRNGALSVLRNGALESLRDVGTDPVLWTALGDRLFGMSRTYRLSIKHGEVMPWGATTAPDAQGRVATPLPFTTQALTVCGGSLFAAVGNTVYWTVPFMPDVCVQDTAYLQFPEPIVMLQGTRHGIWAASASTAWFAALSESAEFVLASTHKVGAVGRASCLDAVGNAVWASSQGLVLGSDDGQLATPQRGRVEHTASRSAAFFNTADGAFVALASQMRVHPHCAAHRTNFY